MVREVEVRTRRTINKKRCIDCDGKLTSLKTFSLKKNQKKRMSNIALLPKIGEYKDKSYDDLKTIAESAGFHPINPKTGVVMPEDKLTNSLMSIVTYKSLFKPVPAGYILNRTTKKNTISLQIKLLLR